MKRPDRVRRRASVMAAATVTILAAGCTSNDEPAAVPTTPADTPTAGTPTPTSEPTPTLSRDDAVAAAESAVRDYLALFDEIITDPERDVGDLESVATDQALQWSTYLITDLRESGNRRTGTQSAVEFTITRVVLDPTAAGGSDHPSVTLTACVDVVDVDIFDQNDNSAVAPDRLDRVLVDYVVRNEDWPDGQRWLVARDDAQLTDSSPPEFVPCDE